MRRLRMWWLRRKLMRRHAQGLGVDVFEALEAQSLWIRDVADRFHRHGLHGYENDVLQVGREWADAVPLELERAITGDGNLDEVRRINHAALDEIQRILIRSGVVSADRFVSDPS